jgi:fucose 4-O-acetylase-like acetyltransferase
MSQRNYTISICKAIAIILMVVGHAEAPELLTNFIYTFHMPLFFITAGYFFTQRHVDEPWRFCASRFKGLYVPFLKWGILFLLLHNVWFHFGILNEQYGNWTGGVTHPYSLRMMVTRLVMMVYSMSGYDEFMAGAFWFFRALLVSSILFMVLYRLLREKDAEDKGMWRASFMICLFALSFMVLHCELKFKMQFYPNGFWRETWGIFFFGIGVLYREVVEPRLSVKLWQALAMLALLIGAGYLHCSGMNNGCKRWDIVTLPITGCVGFLMVKYFSAKLDAHKGRLRNLLIYIGENTLYVFVFHILAFKVVSLLKIWYYGLDFGQIGCHMVIHYRNHDDLFWVLYSIAGVALPLICLNGFRKLKASLKVQLKSH